ncbi:MAG: histidine kinase dimerization/phosphoacceptor domain -containing protein [Methanobacteriaceae archaeon]|nr:histidine kinase dimerization/phosphoacceptor domain -containing protein [Methanobacteriaceae archaeon]
MDNKLRTLLFEDNHGDAGLIEEMLEESGVPFKLTHVETLKDGLETPYNNSFDIILLDLGLPDSDGIDTFFRVQDKYPKFPIIILTGLSDESVALKALQDGAQDYLLKKDLESSFLSRSIRYSIERKRAEEQINKSLEEKEIMLNEIHHRVKNNLQIISSLLHLQEISTNEEDVIDMLRETEGRVKTMAMVHEKLYDSPSLTDINFNEYLEKLVYSILYTYGITKDTIKIKLHIEDINLNTDTAIPLGLIINELLTNSIKYAFKKPEGTITLKLKSLPGKIELTVADDGIGLPEDIDPQNPQNLGLQLVKSLIEQLDGELKMNRNNGTEFKIIFKEQKYKKRI